MTGVLAIRPAASYYRVEGKDAWRQKIGMKCLLSLSLSRYSRIIGHYYRKPGPPEIMRELDPVDHQVEGAKELPTQVYGPDQIIIP